MTLPLPRLRAFRGPQRPGWGSQPHAACGCRGCRVGGPAAAWSPDSRDAVTLHFQVLAFSLKMRIRATLWNRNVFGGIWLRSLDLRRKS